MRAKVVEITPHGVGGVAVLDVCGADLLSRLETLAGRALPKPGEVHFVRLIRDRDGAAELLDEGLLVGRGSEGLSERIEVHLHGSRAVIQAVREALVDPQGSGHTRDATVGDSLEVRYRGLAAAAPTILGARLALSQLEGPRVLATALDALLEEPLEAARTAGRMLASHGRYGPLFHPQRIVLAGPTNAGKSTLLNLLAGEELALVSSIAGTTRDTVLGRVVVDGWPLIVVDTAGERDADTVGPIERAGQVLARDVAARADAVLWLVQACAKGSHRDAPSCATGPPEIVLHTRSAEGLGGDHKDWPPGHVATIEEPEHALKVVGESLRQTLHLPPLADLERRVQGGNPPPIPLDDDLRSVLKRVAGAESDSRELGAALDSLRALM